MEKWHKGRNLTYHIQNGFCSQKINLVAVLHTPQIFYPIHAFIFVGIYINELRIKLCFLHTL